MAYVLKNGTVIFSMSDALDYIDPEIADIIQAEITEQKEEVKAIKYELNELRIEQEKEQDYNHSLLCDIRENLDAITEYIEDSKRLNKDQLLKMLNKTWKIVNNEL